MDGEGDGDGEYPLLFLVPKRRHILDISCAHEEAHLGTWKAPKRKRGIGTSEAPKRKRQELLSPRKLQLLLEQEDQKSDSPKNYSFWTFAAHMTQIPPKRYNFTQFAAFFKFLFFEIN